MCPTDARDIVLYPCSQIDTAGTGFEIIKIAIPKTGNVFVLFAGQDCTVALKTFVLLARLLDRRIIKRRRIIIAKAIVAHNVLVLVARAISSPATGFDSAGTAGGGWDASGIAGSMAGWERVIVGRVPQVSRRSYLILSP